MQLSTTTWTLSETLKHCKWFGDLKYVFLILFKGKW